MKTNIIKTCPSCGGEMDITALTCQNCGIEIKGNFDYPKCENIFSVLTQEEMEFIKIFINHEGNISVMQEILQKSYPYIKGQLNLINIKLEKGEEKPMEKPTFNNNCENAVNASHVIIDKLINNGGHAECPVLRGDPIKIWLESDGIHNSSFPSLVCEPRIFDAIVEKANELGGKMYRGDAAAQQGKKIGFDDFDLDTIDAFIGIKFYGAQVGKATTRRSTYYAMILAWAGICTNNRSDGIGGYIQLLPPWKK